MRSFQVRVHSILVNGFKVQNIGIVNNYIAKILRAPYNKRAIFMKINIFTVKNCYCRIKQQWCYFVTNFLILHNRSNRYKENNLYCFICLVYRLCQ